jgi:hypothetical protein
VTTTARIRAIRASSHRLSSAHATADVNESVGAVGSLLSPRHCRETLPLAKLRRFRGILNSTTTVTLEALADLITALRGHRVDGRAAAASRLR